MLKNTRTRRDDFLTSVQNGKSGRIELLLGMILFIVLAGISEADSRRV